MQEYRWFLDEEGDTQKERTMHTKTKKHYRQSIVHYIYLDYTPPGIDYIRYMKCVAGLPKRNKGKEDESQPESCAGTNKYV